MIREIWGKYTGVIALFAGGASAAVYLTMITITLAHLETVSGLRPFDMRPAGYSPEEAANLLNRLGTSGRDYYVRNQIPLDTLYPALLSLTMIATFSWLGKRKSNSKLVSLGIALSVGTALFDYGENLGIATMIWDWPNIPDHIVIASSIATITKSVLTTLSVIFLSILGFVAFTHSPRPLRS